MDSTAFNRELLAFLQQSPTPFHAVANMAAALDAAGFTALNEKSRWELEPGKAYYVVRNRSALVAFRTGKQDLAESGVHIIGTHTDSPCLKVKPTPEISSNGYVQLGVEVYGGALLAPWFDRDLSLAGRVDYLDKNGAVCAELINCEQPLATIPSVAIHLFRTVHENRTINPQKELVPIILQQDDANDFKLDNFLADQLAASGVDIDRVLAHELYFYDVQPPALVGLRQQFIASARLDNLLSCYAACQALINGDPDQPGVLVCNDHEEVGSMTASGAQGPFLKSALRRIIDSQSGSSDAMTRMIANSLMLSVDNAHGVHPNYQDKHDDQHKPLLNSGPVIKLNANQRYASNSESVARFKALCESCNVPYQSFVMRSDMACGSTIGPLTAAELGVTTVDVGVATFGMHSIRELAGADDPHMLATVLTQFYS